MNILAEKSRKTYSERWTLEEERLLIKFRISLDRDFQSSHSIPRQCWEKVIKQSGLTKSIKNVTQKWQNILKKYKKMTQPQSGVSTEDGEILPTQWELFDELHDFLKSKHGLHPIYIIDSDITNDEGAGPSTLSNSSSSTYNVCSISSSESIENTLAYENNECTPQKKARRSPATNNVLISHLSATAEEVRKSVKNIEKLVTYVTKKMFPDGDFPELE